MPYDPELVQPMREELTRAGIRELLSAEEAESFLTDSSGTALVIVNSVCGCAAGGARPAVVLALKHETRPDRVATVFAGQDLEATNAVREFLADIPPSSPSFALLKEGKVVHFVPRHQIEGNDPQTIALGLMNAFDAHCTAGAKR